MAVNTTEKLRCEDKQHGEQKEVSVTMANKQWGKLVTYLLMTTNHRKGEMET